MATLKNAETGEKLFLLPHNMLDKYSKNKKKQRPYINCCSLYTLIDWDGHHWHLNNATSNNAYINDTIVLPNSKYQLRKNDEIRLENRKEESWILLDETPPRSMLIPLSPDLPPFELNGNVTLPCEGKSDITLFTSRFGQWICESPLKTFQLKSGDIVGNRNSKWQFIDSSDREMNKHDNVKSRIDIDDVSFIFNVSQNEEHVSLDLIANDKLISLGERSHHYMLLLLARKKIADMNLQVSASEQGWVNTASFRQMMGLSEHHTNIQIYRIRKQMTESLPECFNYYNIIERRSGLLRFSGSFIEVHGGLKNAERYFSYN